MWALLGVAVMSIVMRIDYRTYRNERLIWTLLAIVTVLLVGRALLATRQRDASLVRHRRLWHAALRARQGRRHPVHRSRSSNGGCIASTRSATRLLPIAIITGGLVGLDPARTRLRHGRVAAGRDRHDDFCRRSQLSLSRRRGAAVAACALRHPDVGRLPAPSHASPSSIRGRIRLATASRSSSR